MKLAFSGHGRYADFSDGYELYESRAKKKDTVVDKTVYARIVKSYCKIVAERLLNDGMVDLPKLGSIASAIITRKPQYRGDKFVGYGKMDWKKGHYDGKLKTFGIVFLPRRERNGNMRCFGYVANRRLFVKMKEKYESGNASWAPLEFTDEMI